MNKQKGLAPILIVLLIALGIGGYLIYQKQTKSVSQPVIQSTPVPSNPESSASAETANWKTYTNTKYVFSFKYPSTYVSKEFKIATSPDYPEVKFGIEFRDINSLINIAIAKNYKGLNLNNALGDGPELMYGLPRDKTINRLKVGNLDAVIVTNVPAGQFGIAADVIFFRNQDIYQITLTGSSSPDSLDNFKEILSTFRFD